MSIYILHEYLYTCLYTRLFILLYTGAKQVCHGYVTVVDSYIGAITILMANIVMAYIVMAYVGMTYIVMVCIVMA